VKVHDSALKHGVLPEDAVQAADWPLWVEPLEEEVWPHRELRLGFDTQARLLETVVLIFESWRRDGHPRHASPQTVLGTPALTGRSTSPQAEPRAGTRQVIDRAMLSTSRKTCPNTSPDWGRQLGTADRPGDGCGP